MDMEQKNNTDKLRFEAAHTEISIHTPKEEYGGNEFDKSGQDEFTDIQETGDVAVEVDLDIYVDNEDEVDGTKVTDVQDEKEDDHDIVELNICEDVEAFVIDTDDPGGFKIDDEDEEEELMEETGTVELNIREEESLTLKTGISKEYNKEKPGTEDHEVEGKDSSAAGLELENIKIDTQKNGSTEEHDRKIQDTGHDVLIDNTEESKDDDKKIKDADVDLTDETCLADTDEKCGAHVSEEHDKSKDEVNVVFEIESLTENSDNSCPKDQTIESPEENRKIEFALEFEGDSSLENVQLYVSDDNIDEQVKGFKCNMEELMIDSDDNDEDEGQEIVEAIKSEILNIQEEINESKTSDIQNLERIESNKHNSENLLDKGNDKDWPRVSKEEESNMTGIKVERQGKGSRKGSTDSNLEYTLEQTEFLEVGMLGFVMMERTEHADIDSDVDELPALHIQESPRLLRVDHQLEYDKNESAKEKMKSDDGLDECTTKVKGRKDLTVDVLEDVDDSDCNLSPSTVASDTSLETVKENIVNNREDEISAFKSGMLASSSVKELSDLKNKNGSKDDLEVDLEPKMEPLVKIMDLKLLSGVKDTSKDFESPSGSEGQMIINAALSEDEDYHRIMSRTSVPDFESDFGDSLDLVPGSDLEESQEWVSDEGNNCCHMHED